MKEITKSFLTVTEVAHLVRLSNQRFYELLKSGIFPMPIRHPSVNRPLFTAELAKKCIAVRDTGVGANGEPIIFYSARKVRTARLTVSASSPRRAVPSSPVVEHSELIDALKNVGVEATPKSVADAMAHLFPQDSDEMEKADIFRKVFGHLRGIKSARKPSDLPQNPA